MTTIELNDQESDVLKELLIPIADNDFNSSVKDQKYSRTYQTIAQQIINKLEE